MRVAGFLVLVGCAHNVPQDRATGADGKPRGATPLVLENGEARVRGIVTYPGGDRVDWKVIELPEKQTGKLDLQLTWQTPRPGLQVAFDVFDQYNHPVVATSGKRGRARSATINDALGTYFVRIYAPKRGDAGAYVLKASFEPAPDISVDVTKVPIADPPKLAAVPPPVIPCDTFDRNNPSCTHACPDDAPPTWKGCEKKIADEKAAEDAKARALARAACLANHPKDVITKIIHLEVSSNGVSVKLDTGTDEQAGLTTGWTAYVLRAGTDERLPTGKITLLNVGKQITRGRSGLTTDQLNQNQRVVLVPPAANCP